MKLQVNIKARLQRHARSLSSLNRKSVFSILNKFKVIGIIIVLILPIYPSFGETSVDAEGLVGEYDNSTIITSFYGDKEENYIFSKDSGFIKSNSISVDLMDLTGVNKIIYYTITDGDTISSIAQKFNISEDSIVLTNNLNSNNILYAGNTIKIPPVSGIVYSVTPGDTTQQIAYKYNIDEISILEQNQLDPTEELKIGQQLILPGASKQIYKSKILANTTAKEEVKNNINNNYNKQETKNKNTNNTTPKKLQSKKVKPEKINYSIAWTGKGNKFAWGYCTYYVANHKNVTWRGNAKQWLANARAQGVPTGSTPIAGSIVVFAGRGYNPYYGHVGIVAEVNGDTMIIKDMNYRRKNEVTVRKVSIYESGVIGYIYVD